MTSKSSWDVVVWNNWLLLGRKSSDLLVRKFPSLFLWQSPINYCVFSLTLNIYKHPRKKMYSSFSEHTFCVLYYHLLKVLWHSAIEYLSESQFQAISVFCLVVSQIRWHVSLSFNFSCGCVIFSCWINGNTGISWTTDLLQKQLSVILQFGTVTFGYWTAFKANCSGLTLKWIRGDKK